jgi:O-antigen/teichoic acid export membrane protein
MTPDSGSTQGSAATPPEGGWASVLGARLTRDTGLYTTGAFAGFLLSLIQVVVVTHYLSPSEYGQLALLLFFAALTTIVYNLGTLQGTFLWVFGATGDEDADDDDVAGARDKRKGLGTGLLVTLMICAGGTAVIAIFSSGFAQLILGDSSSGDLVLIAAASGAAGALWRFTTNVLRLERRPYAYVGFSMVRPVLVIGITIPLVAAGHGVHGAIVGTAIGSIAAVPVVLVTTRRSYALGLDRGDLKMILRKGAIFIPVVASFWIAQNVDLYALSKFATDTQVGLYRLAGRIASFIHYFSSALFMAWTPLARTLTFRAAEKEHSREVIGGTMLTYFVLGGMLLILGLTVTADGLVRIAPSSYAAAAPLVPLLGGAYLAHGLLVAVYRVARFPRKRTYYVISAIASAAVFIGLSFVLIPWLGATGAALSVIGGFMFAALGMTWLSQHGANPVAIDYARITGGIALAGVCLGVARGAGALAGDWQPLVEVVALFLYPVLLGVTGVITRDQRHQIRVVLRQALSRHRADAATEQRLRMLDDEDLAELELATIGGWALNTIAASDPGAEPSEVSVRLVRSLRQVAGIEATSDHDDRIGQFLFSDLAVAERDAISRALLTDEVDAGELHTLERTLETLRKVPRSVWDELEAERNGAEREGADQSGAPAK